MNPLLIGCELAILVAFYLRVKIGVDDTGYYPGTMETFNY